MVIKKFELPPLDQILAAWRTICEHHRHISLDEGISGDAAIVGVAMLLYRLARAAGYGDDEIKDIFARTISAESDLLRRQVS